ncbi:MAG: sensor histidine kinase, partial [Chthoniobacteraceae bacterium]
MALHAISPTQIRALLLLLVCVPLIPTVLLVRLMVDAVQSARDTALAQAGTALTAVAYQQQLTRSIAGMAEQHAAASPTPEQVHRELQAVFGEEVAVQVTNERGEVLVGSQPLRALPIAQASVAVLGPPWSVQLFWEGESDLGEAVDQQIRTYIILGGVAVCAILSIAFTAALAVNRQFTLQQLKSSAVATVAHELRTPIASIRMLVDTLREGRVRGDTQRQEYLELIATEALRLSRLAEHFLTFSRLDRNTADLHLEPLDPREVVRDATRAMEPRLQSPGCTFRLEMPEQLPQILGDRDAL